MKILEEKNNFLSNRKEITFIIESEKNPNFEEITSLVSEHLKGEKENVAVKQIKGKFGRDTFKVVAYLYNSKEDKEKFEPKKKVKTGTQPAK